MHNCCLTLYFNYSITIVEYLNLHLTKISMLWTNFFLGHRWQTTRLVARYMWWLDNGTCPFFKFVEWNISCILPIGAIAMYCIWKCFVSGNFICSGKRRSFLANLQAEQTLQVYYYITGCSAYYYLQVIALSVSLSLRWVRTGSAKCTFPWFPLPATARGRASRVGLASQARSIESPIVETRYRRVSMRDRRQFYNQK